MSKSIQNRALSIIYGKGRGWAFSQKDLLPIGSRSAIDVTLHRLLKKGTIRRVIRGIYDYPKYSETLKTVLSPDYDQVAQALARKFGWRIQFTGPTALNILGLSTQVPARIMYLSDGPDRIYTIDTYSIAFKQTALKDSVFRLRESALIVHALNSLGPEQITPEIIQKIQTWLDPKKYESILKDTITATGWVYEVIRQICSKET